ncbi:unnamed protein product [Nezara viridula]|uniref:Uncharacterized protein n=1 Tax=Nezara viridula TaxID=85310 RepID=A0A9P0H242_NEZVI|nr:unnamed protein product [Nezara viridula]
MSFSNGTTKERIWEFSDLCPSAARNAVKEKAQKAVASKAPKPEDKKEQSTAGGEFITQKIPVLYRTDETRVPKLSRLTKLQTSERIARVSLRLGWPRSLP